MTAGNAQRSLGSALAVFAWALACSSFTSDDISHPGAADLQAAPVSGEERISGEEDHVALEGPTVGNAPREIDLGGLVARLRDTEALGFFTKLALKNEVDDLLDGMRGYHAVERGDSLRGLRERFDLLLLKLRTLLQDDDQKLAVDITAGRETLWNQLADPIEFAQIVARGEER